MRLPGKAPTIS